MQLWCVVALFLCLVAGSIEAKSYQVTAQRSYNVPIISSQNRGQSTFTFNYNTAYVPVASGPNKFTNGLIVRCQNQTAGTLGPSLLSFTQQTSPGQFQQITDKSIVFRPTTSYETYGTEDPRVAYRPSTGDYYMFYSAVQTAKPSLIVRLSLATTKTPWIASSWQRVGPIFPDVNNFQWTKSGALLIRDGHPGPSYLIFGDSSFVKGLQIATTQDLIHYTLLPGIYLPVRNNSFDSMLVEAGPPPMLLSDGNYLFIYNSARQNASSPDHFEYNIGWLIINGSNPLHIIQRSDTPLLSPQLGWEVGVPPFLSLTPNVVFCEGMHEGSERDSFVIYYGAADSVIGEAKVYVTIK